MRPELHRFTRAARLPLFLAIHFASTILPLGAEPSWETFRLDNGLEVTLVEYRIFPVTSLAIIYGAGAELDPAGKAGLAHLTEHLMFRGTPEHDVPRELERMGASFNAMTLDDRVLFYETFPTEYLDEALLIEADRMVNSILSSENIDLEKRVVVEEGNLTAGPGQVEEVLNVNGEEVRAFYRQHYRPGNARMILVGSFEFDVVRQTIERTFDGTALAASAAIVADDAAFERIGMNRMEYELQRESPLKTMLALADLPGAEEREAFLRYREWMVRDDAPAAAAEQEHYARVTREVLPGGMRVLLFSHPDFRILTVEGYVAAGAYFETADEPLLAVLTANVMAELARQAGLEAEGARLDFSAVSFNTYIEGRGQPEARTPILELIETLVRRPPVTEAILGEVKRRLVADLRAKAGWVQLRAFNEASRHFYEAGHVFHVEPIEEQSAAVEGYTLDDVMDFHRRTYRSADAILVVVGNFDRTEIMQEVRNLFGDWKQDRPPSVVHVPDVDAPDGPAPIVIQMPQARDAHVLMTHPGLLRRTDDDYYAGLIANVAVGGSVLSSRLGLELRDRMGLVYEVGSVFFEATKGAGLWGISLDVDPERTRLAIETTRETIREMVDEGISRDEALFHRSTVRGAFIVSLSIPLALAGRILDAEFFGIGHDYIYEFGNIVDRVTPEDINRAIRDHFFADKLLIVEIHPVP